MISVVVLLLGLIVLSLFLATYFDEPFEKTIPLSLMWITFFLLVAGCFDVLLQGLYAVFIIAAVLYVAVILYGIRNGLAVVIKKACTPSLFMFAVFFLVVFFANRGMVPHDWDEFAYWIFAPKVLCVNDALFTHTHEEMVSAYPQGVAAFQYFVARWVMLCRKTDIFPAGSAYAALQIMQISFVFPLLRREYFRGWLMCLITIVSVFCLPIFFFSNAYSMVLVDCCLGLAVGAGIATILYTPHEEKGLFYDALIISECIFMVLTKRTGFLLAMALAGAFLIDWTYRNWKELAKRWKRLVAWGMCLGTAVIVPYVLYKYETTMDQNVRNVKFVFPDVGGSFILRTDDTSRRIDVVKSFFEQFFIDSYEIGHTGAVLPFYLVILLAAVGIYALYVLYEKKLPSQKVQVALFGGYGFLVYVAWVSVFLYSYVFKLTDTEAGVLNSFGRYMTIGFMPIAYIILFGVLNLLVTLSGRAKVIAPLVVLVILCTIIPMGEPLRFINGRYKEEADENKQKIDRLISLIGEDGLTKGDRLFYISQTDYGNRRNQICYYAYPVPVSAGPWCFWDGEYDPEVGYQENKILFGSSKNAEELEARWELEGVTHVMLHDIDDYFIKTFSSLFAPGVEIQERTIYKFDPATGLLYNIETK